MNQSIKLIGPELKTGEPSVFSGDRFGLCGIPFIMRSTLLAAIHGSFKYSSLPPLWTRIGGIPRSWGLS